MIPSAKPPTLLATLCVLIFHVAGPGSTRGETQPSMEFEAHGLISRSWTHDEIIVFDQGRIVEHGDRVDLVGDDESRFARLLAIALDGEQRPSGQEVTS